MASRFTLRPHMAVATAGAAIAALGVVSGPQAPAVAAPATDGALILVANVDQSGLVNVFHGNGETAGASPIDTAYDNDSDLAAGNFVGSRDTLELAVVDAGGRVRVFDMSTGSPIIELGFTTTYDDNDLVAAGDLDADDIDELLVANGGNETGTIDVFDVAGEGRKAGFGIPDTTFENDGSNSFAVGDVDGDARGEVHVANRSGGRIDIFDPATGTNKPGFGIPDTHFNDQDENEFAVGDVTGDGRVEVLVANGDNGEIDVHDPDTGQELGGVGAGDTTFDNSGENQFKVADVDGDGKAEALVANGGGPAGDRGRIDVIDLDTGLGQAGSGVAGADSGFGEQDVMAVSTFDPGRTADIDQDGIPDRIELDGIRDADGDIVDGWDLAKMGASPCRKDVLIDLDFMFRAADPAAGVTEISHEPTPSGTDPSGNPVVGAVDRVTNAFEAAPVAAVEDCPYEGVSTEEGIGLHIDPLGRGDRVPYDATLNVPEDFEKLKKDHFEPELDPYVHYNVWGSQYKEKNKPLTTSGGLANFTDDGQDFIVTLGGFSGFGSPTTQAGDLMHELGHSLGLDHGGDVETNCKPNYLSIMNYSFSYSGLIDSSSSSKVSVDYSRDTLDKLVEAREVDGADVGPEEAAGIGAEAVGSPEGGTTIPRTLWYDANGARQQDDGDGPLDWNGDKDTSDKDPVDLNDDTIHSAPDDGQCGSEADDETLTGFNDWQKLDKDGLVPPAVSGDAPPVELTAEQFADLQEFWDEELSPDTTVLLDAPRPGFRAASLGVAVDDDFVYATHGYRTVAQPATGDRRGTLVVLDRDTMSVVSRIQVGSGPSAVALDRQRNRAYVTNLGKDSFSLSVVDLATRQVVKEIPLGQGPVDVAVNTRLNRIYASNTFQGVIHVVDGATLEKLEPIAIGAGVGRIAVDESTNTIWAAMLQRGVPQELAAVGTVVDDGVTRPRVLPRIDLGNPAVQPVDVAVDPVRGRVWVAGLGAAGVQPPAVMVLDSRTRQEVERVNLPGPTRAVDVDVDEGLVLAVGDRGVETLSATTGERLRHMDAGVPFSVGIGEGASRDLYVGDFLTGELTRRSYSSGDPR